MSDPIQQLKIRSLSQAPVGQNQRQVPESRFPKSIRSAYPYKQARLSSLNMH